MNSISVIICTYNGADRIGRTLDALARCHATFPVEIILVDNNSSDGVAGLARDVWNKKGNAEFALRIVCEAEPGLGFARRAGIRAARSELLVFCDDDNWLDSQYLRIAHDVMSRHPEVGVLGSRALAQFEGSPPAWFLRYQDAFAIGDQGTGDGDVTESRGWVWGAGFVVRASALAELDAAQIMPAASDRVGSKMTTGGDVEICLYLRELGWRIWYSPELFLTHYMPKARFEWRKFISLMFQNGILDTTVQSPMRNERGGLVRAAVLLKQYIRRLPQLALKQNLVVPSLYFAGQIYGLVFERQKSALVRDNKRRLSVYRTQRQGALSATIDVGERA